jgi:hypothetical protein
LCKIKPIAFDILQTKGRKSYDQSKILTRLKYADDFVSDKKADKSEFIGFCVFFDVKIL